MVLVLVATAVPVFATENRCTEPDIQTCLNDMAAKRTQGWLGLDFDHSDPTVIRVEDVTPYSPASKAGFHSGDVLLTLNGASFRDEDALRKAKGDWLPGQTVTFLVRRASIQKQIVVTLGRYSETEFATMVGLHMLQYHVTSPTVVTQASAADGSANAK
jgi:S1-C subfamily serine protease